MLVLEKTEKLFEKIKCGNYDVKDDFFEHIWINFTRLSYDPKTRPLMAQMDEWAKAHAAEHPDFFDLMHLTLGFMEFLSDDFELALQYLNTAYMSFTEKNDEDGVAAASIATGFLYRTTGDINLALKYGLQGLEQLVQSGKYKMFQLLGNYWIGSVYAETGHLTDALRLFQNGLNLDYPSGVQSLGSRLTNGIAGVYMKEKRYGLALENYQKALALCDTSTESTFKSRGLTDLGDYYFKMGNYPEAIRYNEEALALRQEMKIQNACITNMMNLGNIYKMQGKMDAAVTMFEQALRIAEEIKVNVKSYQLHKLLSDIFLGRGDTLKSFEHYKAFHEIKEEVNHEDAKHKVKNQIQLFQAEQTKKENVIITAQKKVIEEEKKRSDELLLNILPEEVAEELKAKGTAEAKHFAAVSVLFTDFKNFTRISETMTPKELVEEIHSCFKAFDQIMEKHGMEKIKTIGDSYMCAGGLPIANNTHAEDAIRAGLDIQRFMDTRMKERKAEGKESFQIRMGIHTGPVVAGIVGIKKFAYDIWGDTVNTASRMESSGEVGKVNISATTYDLVKDKFNCVHRGKIAAKGKGEMDMYFVEISKVF